MATFKGIKHIGIATAEGKKLTDFYVENLGGVFISEEPYPEQNQVSFTVRMGDCDLEIMEPVSDHGAVAGFLAKKGPGLQHISMEVEGIAEIEQDLTAKGIQIVAKNFDGPVRYMFLSPKSTGGVLVEMFENA